MGVGVLLVSWTFKTQEKVWLCILSKVSSYFNSTMFLFPVYFGKLLISNMILVCDGLYKVSCILECPKLSLALMQVCVTLAVHD